MKTQTAAYFSCVHLNGKQQKSIYSAGITACLWQSGRYGCDELLVNVVASVPAEQAAETLVELNILTALKTFYEQRTNCSELNSPEA